MKKIISSFLAMSVLLTLTSCRNNSTDDSSSSSIAEQMNISFKEANVTMAEDFSDIMKLDKCGNSVLIFGKDSKNTYIGYVTDTAFTDYRTFYFIPKDDETVISACMSKFGKAAVITYLDGNTMLYVINSDGEVCLESDLDEIFSDAELWGNIIADSENFIIVNSDNEIFSVDSKGNNLGEIDLKGNILYGISPNSEGIPTALLQRGEETFTAEITDGKLGECVKCTALSSSPYAMSAGNSEYSLIANFGNGLFGFKDSQWIKLTDYMDNTFSASFIYGIIPTGDNEYAVLDYGNDGARIILLSERDISEIKSRKTIKFAVAIGGEPIGNDIIKKYNSENDDYKIEVVNYSERGTYPEDWSKALKEDIILGNAPDIVSFDSDIPIDSFGSKNSIFVDFYPLIDSDPNISRDDFVDGYLEGMESNGKLLMIESTFHLRSLCIKDKFSGGLTEWDIDQFIDIYNNMPDGMQFNSQIEGGLRRNVFKDLINVNSFVDYKNAVCSFDSPEFIKALKLFNDNKLGLTWEDYENYGDNVVYYAEEGLLYRNDKAMVDMCTLMCFGHIKNQLKGRFNEPATLIGYPSENGNGTYRMVTGGYGIMANSRNIEGAWDFLKYFLFESDYEPGYFSGLEEKYNKQLENEKTFHVDIDPETGEEGNADVYWLGGDFDNIIELEPFTDEEAEKYDALVMAALKNPMKYDNNVDKILNEELDACFEGERSAEETAKIIQNRVSIYLSEQYT